MARDFDELDEAEAKECWKCNTKLTDSNRYEIMEFGNQSYYCQQCAEGIMEDEWNKGDSVKAAKTI